jgi:hypothetical protein
MDDGRRRSTFGALDALWRDDIDVIGRERDVSAPAASRDGDDAPWKDAVETTTTSELLPDVVTTKEARDDGDDARAKIGLLPDSDDDDESDIEFEETLTGGAGAWSAYHGAKVDSGEDAIAALEESERAKERARLAMEAKEKEKLNASGRPKRSVVMNAEVKVKEGVKEAPRSAPAQPEARVIAALPESDAEDDEDDMNGTRTDVNVCTTSTSKIGDKDKENRVMVAKPLKGTKRAAAPKAQMTKKKTKVVAPKVTAVAKKSDSMVVENRCKSAPASSKGDKALCVLLSSGFSERQTKALTKKIQRLGGRTTESLREFDVFVTEAPLLRTKNVMAASLLGKPIVSAAWVEKSSKSSAFAEYAPHVVRDKKFEAAHNFTPTTGSTSTTTASAPRNCFTGKSFAIWVDPKHPTGPATLPEHLKDLLVVAGARPTASFAKANLAVVISAVADPSIDNTRVFAYDDILEAFLTGSINPK